jgi:4-hydroxy 2-oxovalerate aldolase
MTTNTKTTLIDCTFRDGGYYNEWDFDRDLINVYLKAMNESAIDYVEIGFRSFDIKGFKGACAYSTDEFIRSLDLIQGQKIGVMVNAAEVVNHSFGATEAIKLLFSSQKNSPVTLVRFASHLHEFEATLPACQWLKNQGYLVGINLMQIADRSEEEIEKIARAASKYDLDALYFADSMGSMDAMSTAKIVTILKRSWKGALGIHTHDNMGRAIENTLSAVREGVTWVDSTVTGMGRGPGNAQTEYVLVELEETRTSKPAMTSLLALIRDHFAPMQKKYGWGKNPYYYLSGKYGIHPTYLQEMLSDPRYGEAEILSVMNHLRLVGGKKFNAETMEAGRQMFGDSAEGTWSPRETMSNRDILIVGSGPTCARHAVAIEEYVRRKKPIVIALNTVTPIDDALISYRVASHPFRLLMDAASYKGMTQPVILPIARLEDAVGPLLVGATVLDFGLTVRPGGFSFQSKTACSPSSLAIAYALAIASSGQAKQIYLAGFDGYSADDPRNTEMDELLSAYQQAPNALNLASITPTRYMIPTTSVYAL